jgi:hypothetical protein
VAEPDGDAGVGAPQAGQQGRLPGLCHLLHPRAEVPRTGDSCSNPGNPIHYEFNLVKQRKHSGPRTGISVHEGPPGR